MLTACHCSPLLFAAFHAIAMTLVVVQVFAVWLLLYFRAQPFLFNFGLGRQLNSLYISALAGTRYR